ncbi:MAG: tRNA pseudouridine(38-40) synthase TruA [Bacteroidota bacterium]|nr:tRNA pseudouridine(38-40) synthase TruA [Bacteroidota bacterium]
MRFFIHIGYHGFHYRGWQRQAGVMSVQETLENVISKVLKTPTTIYGCGRTDARVSASQYFFHLDVTDPGEYDLLFRLNKVLPADIAIFDIIKVEEGQHARFDASVRTYDYFIHTRKDPFLSEMSSLYQYDDLDWESIIKARSLLTSYSDYRAFCKSPEKHRSTICKVTEAQWYRNKNGDRFRLRITSNRFLKSMIRILVGKFLEIGKGEFTVEQFENALRTKETPSLIIGAHPQGLYLSEVKYPYLEIKPRIDFSGIAGNEEWIRMS